MAAVDFRIGAVSWPLRDVAAAAVEVDEEERAREDGAGGDWAVELETRNGAAGRKRRRPWPPPAGPAPKRRRVAASADLTLSPPSSEPGPASPPPAKCESRLECVETQPVGPASAASAEELKIEETSAEEVKIEEGTEVASENEVKIQEASADELKVAEGAVTAASAVEVKTEEEGVASGEEEKAEEREDREPSTSRGRKQGPSRDRRSCHQCKRVKPSPEVMIRCQHCDLRIYCAACIRNRQCLDPAAPCPAFFNP